MRLLRVRDYRFLTLSDSYLTTSCKTSTSSTLWPESDNMVDFRGTEISMVSQSNIRKLPELVALSDPDSFESSATPDYNSTASCYVPIYTLDLRSGLNTISMAHALQTHLTSSRGLMMANSSPALSLSLSSKSQNTYAYGCLPFL